MDTTKLIERARSSARKRDYNSAVEGYMQALEFNPNDAPTRMELHKLYLRESQEAGKKTNIFGGMFGKVKMLLTTPKTKDQADKVLIELEKALRAKPTDMGVIIDMGKAGLVAEYWDMAIALLEEVRSLKAGGDKKKQAECLRTLGRVYKGARKWPEAIEAFADLTKVEPTDRDAMREARDMAAEQQSNLIDSKGGGDVRGGGARAQQSDEQRINDQIRAIIESGIKTEADATLLWKHEFEPKLAGEVTDPALYEKATEPLLFLHRYDEAKELLGKAQKMQATDPRWGFKIEDIDIRVFTDQLKPLQVKARGGDGAAKEEFHRINAELTAYKFESYSRREKQYPTESLYKQELGRIAFLKKDYDEALRCFQYTRNDPKYQMESLLYMGRSFRAKKQLDIAARTLSEGIDRLQIMNDQKKAMLYERALTYELHGDKEKYKKDLTTLYESDVRYKDVQTRLDKLEG
ncbi:MAG: hypothetical protein ACREJ2_10495 [Planctomycetota bacterium]